MNKLEALKTIKRWVGNQWFLPEELSRKTRLTTNRWKKILEWLHRNGMVWRRKKYKDEGRKKRVYWMISAKGEAYIKHMEKKKKKKRPRKVKKQVVKGVEYDVFV